MFRRLHGGCTVAVLGVLVAGHAPGAEARREPSPTVLFTYERAEGAAQCPEKASIERGVAARLGRNPFSAEGPLAIHARIEPENAGLHATVRVEEDGVARGERELTSATADCTELAASLELILAIAIDPFSLGGKATPEEPPAPAVPPPVSERPPAPVPHPSPAPAVPTHVRAGVALVGVYGTAPGVTGGALVRVELERGRGAFALEGRADLPGTMRVDSGQVSVSLLQGIGAGCLLIGNFGACGLVGAGALQGSGVGFAEEARRTTPYFSVGARATWRAPLTETLRFRADFDLTAPITRTSLLVSGRQVWRTAPVCAAAGLGIDVNFL